MKSAGPECMFQSRCVDRPAARGVRLVSRIRPPRPLPLRSRAGHPPFLSAARKIDSTSIGFRPVRGRLIRFHGAETPARLSMVDEIARGEAIEARFAAIMSTIIGIRLSRDFASRNEVEARECERQSQGDNDRPDQFVRRSIDDDICEWSRKSCMDVDLDPGRESSSLGDCQLAKSSTASNHDADCSLWSPVVRKGLSIVGRRPVLGLQ